MNDRVNINGIYFDKLTYAQTLHIFENFLANDRSNVVVTPNPEAVMLAQKNESFKKSLLAADLCLPDAVGIIIASRILNKKIKSRVTGCDAAHILLNYLSKTDKSIFFLGAADGVAELAAKKMQKKFPGLRVAGTHHGYFDGDNETALLDTLRRVRPDVLLLGMSMPKQEIWAEKNRGLPVKIIMCLGGTLDIMSGNVKRAPKFFRMMGLEWFYRLVSQPKRAKRMLALPKFILLTLKQKFSKKS
ncbi:MAG: WecB/TagA/CpsF family glycosyltransferase [Defluviitaleaceae bacterium]|nr:WecB/TagA/CpsF family glycosyltransferase [Defluviitaleaceae bacterium]